MPTFFKLIDINQLAKSLNKYKGNKSKKQPKCAQLLAQCCARSCAVVSALFKSGDTAMYPQVYSHFIAQEVAQSTKNHDLKQGRLSAPHYFYKVV